MTFGNFLQNKGIQDKYLSEIKKNDDAKNEQLKTLASPQTTSITNVNINNYNYNYNITSNPNIIVQTKSVAPKIVNMTQTQNQSERNINNIKTDESEEKGNSSKNKSKKGDFPPSLQNYITRAFQRCKSNEDIEKCQKNLTIIMENTMKKGDMMTRDWNSYPLPDISTISQIQLHPSPTKKQNNQSQTQIKKQKEEESDLFEYDIKKEKKHKKTQSQYQYTFPLSTSDNSIKKTQTPIESSDNKKQIQSYKPIIGTCTDLEKEYHRMIDQPNPSEVRPEYILKKSMKMLVDKWKRKLADYNYIKEQFRSIRQDLTIQLIQNDFTVKVYETHARIALESHDLSQFNQCQSALIPLYEKQLKGNSNEFFAYRILYTALCEKNEMINILGLVKEKYKDKEKPKEVEHAVKVLKALNGNNYLLLFKLYKQAPNKGSDLIEPFLPRLRIKALQTIAYGFYSEIAIDFIMEQLCFKSKEECLKFLDENNLKRGVNKKQIEVMYCKLNIPALNSSNLLSALIERKI